MIMNKAQCQLSVSEKKKLRKNMFRRESFTNYKQHGGTYSECFLWKSKMFNSNS